MNDLEWLAEWYRRRADGEWEHQYGVTISTLDNPGWSLQVDLDGTALRGAVFEPEDHEDGERWVRFWKDDAKGSFQAAGDASSLPEMIARFRAWVEACFASAK